MRLRARLMLLSVSTVAVIVTVMFALEVGSSVVAEGIEKLGELRAVQLLGVDTGQGYLFGRPSPDLCALPSRRHLFRRRDAHRASGAAIDQSLAVSP